jgi:NAD(P)-dependent dehydrogenase (short-subunit alcohol dehydrogenase family)
MSRSVLVTGGNRGIGLAIAHELKSSGDASP